MLSSLLRALFEASVVVIVVIFQPEIRKALEQLGRNKTWKKYFSGFFSRFGKSDEWVEAVKKSIEDAADTSVLFSRSKTGALMVFERETMLSDIAATGTIIDAQTSVALFGNIFFNKAPLHDGASIIRDGKLHAAGCILPLTDDKTVDINLGTRHRAALGISEQSDSVVLVVSEETGVISLAVNGVLTRDYTRETLVRKLNELLLDETPEDENNNRKFGRGRKKISIGIWTYMSLNSSNDTTVTISNVPIQMDLSESSRKLGLQIFTDEKQTASVTVTGNRTILGSVTESDLTVTAAASSVNSSGNFTLPVSAAKKNLSSNFQITGSTPSSVSVMVDYYKESTFQIQDKILFGVADGYYGATSLPYNSITISGPQTEVMKIKQVAAVASVEDNLLETTDVEADIVLYDENGNELSQKLLTMSFRTLTATISVLTEKSVKVEAGYVNKPSGLDLTNLVEIHPSGILLAGPDDVMKTLVSVKTEEIDFSTLSDEAVTFNTLAINIPEKCKNISNNATAQVKIDLSGMTKKTFDVDTFKVEGLSSAYKAEVTSKNISVTVIGPKSEIESLDADKITATISATDPAVKTGSVEMPVTFRFDGASSCWAYGKYTANLNISESK